MIVLARQDRAENRPSIPTRRICRGRGDARQHPSPMQLHKRGASLAGPPNLRTDSCQTGRHGRLGRRLRSTIGRARNLLHRQREAVRSFFATSAIGVIRRLVSRAHIRAEASAGHWTAYRPGKVWERTRRNNGLEVGRTRNNHEGENAL